MIIFWVRWIRGCPLGRRIHYPVQLDILWSNQSYQLFHHMRCKRFHCRLLHVRKLASDVEVLMGSKIPPVSWDKVCRRKEAGGLGLGLRKTKIQNNAFMIKLGWGMITKKDTL